MFLSTFVPIKKKRIPIYLMEKKILSLLSSTRLMAVLFILFAVAMAAGTFIEDAYNTDTARVIVYNAVPLRQSRQHRYAPRQAFSKDMRSMKLYSLL